MDVHEIGNKDIIPYDFCSNIPHQPTPPSPRSGASVGRPRKKRLTAFF